MLFLLNGAKKLGCVSVGVVVCASVGYNGEKWSA